MLLHEQHHQRHGASDGHFLSTAAEHPEDRDWV